MGIFSQFFERMMDSIDEVEDVEVDAPATHSNSKTDRFDTNAELRAETLREMEIQYDEPMDLFAQRIARNQEIWSQRRERNREIQRRIRIRDEQREEERRAALAQAISNDVERTVQERIDADHLERSMRLFSNSVLAQATSHAHIDRLRRNEIFGHSATSMWMDEPSPNSVRGVARLPRILGERPEGLLRTNALLTTQSNLIESIRVPTVTTSSNQDYFQLESQLVEFAELVLSMMQAETPADLRMQQDIVSKQIDNILMKKKIKEQSTRSDTEVAAPLLEIELD